MSEAEINYMKYSSKRLFFFLGAFLVFFSFSVGTTHASDESLPVEGIAYESKDPSQSFAVINGDNSIRVCRGYPMKTEWFYGGMYG